MHDALNPFPISFFVSSVFCVFPISNVLKTALQARTDGERYMQGLLLKWTKEQKEVHARDLSLLAAKSIRMVLPKGGETLHVC